MVFSSPYFLFFYLPIVIFFYYISPLRLRNLVLLIVNLIFYGWGEPVYIMIMFASVILNYIHGLLISRAKDAGNLRQAKGAVASSVIFNLALLFFFKYWDFIAGTLASVGLQFMPVLGLELPIGISFYTFQTMSYTIDVYREDAHVQKNIITFGTYVTLFPQLIAGPIVRYKDLGDQLNARKYSVEKFTSGVQRFVIGLSKKVLLANNLGRLWDVMQTSGDGLTAAGAWMGILAFGLQLYFDFSGYSDMAIGLGKMLGFEFPENFNYPYLSRSVSEFWRRWHISLGTWFRDYLYIPLGGNRVRKGRLVLNLLILWAATGLWHGASWNFLLWGLYFFFWIMAEKLFLGKFLKKIPALFSHLYGLLVVFFGWVFFAIEDLPALGTYLKSMFGFGSGMRNGSALYYLSGYLPLLIIAAIGCTSLASRVWQRLPRKFCRIMMPVLLIAGLVLSTAYLVDGTYNPFLYFRF